MTRYRSNFRSIQSAFTTSYLGRSSAMCSESCWIEAVGQWGWEKLVKGIVDGRAPEDVQFCGGAWDVGAVCDGEVEAVAELDVGWARFEEDEEVL